MQLLEIEEPEVVVKKHELAIGIDFGTTNSLVAFSKDHKPYIIGAIPSIVRVDEEGKWRVSDEGIKSVKRKLVSLNNEEAAPIKASAAILNYLKSSAQKHLGSEVTKAVITVPAYFDDTARSNVAMAARLAGLEVLRLISEPTAAAYAYGLENKSEGVYLVYDLGGGTFDVSVLNMQMGVFQVLAVGGDSELGGDDIDALIAKKMNISRDEAKKVKEEGEVEIDEIIYPAINRSMEIVRDVISEVDRPIDGIILVGGSTRLPIIKKELTRRFGLSIFDNLDPDSVVALGAALQAENLTGKGGDLLIDVVPLSLGMELMGGLHEKIITRNTPIPTSVTKEFTTYSDNQTAMTFHIVQGERELVQDCRSLARFELQLKPAKAGTHRIEITFAIDADGLVKITARDKDTENSYSLELKPTFGLKEEDMINMLKEAFANVREDHETRKILETSIEANRVIERLKSLIKQ